MSYGLTEQLDPIVSLQLLFGTGSPLQSASSRLADAHDPRGLAAVRSAIMDRYEAQVLFSPAAKPVNYGFSIDRSGRVSGAVSVAGTPEPVSTTLLFMQPDRVNTATFQHALSAGELVNLAA